MGDGQIVTFYSFGGGAGRSMALANAAVHLARHGPVLMVDWNLEAPALHHFFPSIKAVEAPGLIDLFVEMEEGAGAAPVSPEAAIEAVAPDRFAQETSAANLYLLPAGRLDPDYTARVAGFDWRSFDERHHGLIPALAAHWRRRYRFVLIDSRSGVNELSGFCAMMLPDRLVLLFTPGRTSLEGALDVARLACEYRQAVDPARPLSLFPVPSRVETAEPVLRDRWRFGPGGYEERWEAFLCEQNQLPVCRLHAWFTGVTLPYQPRFSFGEEIVGTAGSGAEHPTPLERAYAELARRLASAAPPWTEPGDVSAHVDVDGEWLTAEEAETRLLARVPQLMGRRDNARLGETLQCLAGLEARAGRAAEARAYYQQALVLFRTLEARPQLATLLEEMGRLELAHDSAEEAWRCFNESLSLAGEDLPPLGRARLLLALADVERGLLRLDSARSRYREALEIYEADHYRLGVAAVCRSLAELECLTDPAQAEAGFERAVQLFELERETGPLAACLRALADLHRRHGRLEEAGRQYTRSLEVLHGNGHLSERARTLLGIARIDRRLRRYAEAAARYQEARDLFSRCGEEAGVAAALEGIAGLELRRGNLADARERYEQGLDAAARANEPKRLASLSQGLGEVAQRTGDYEAARACFERALEVYRALYHSVGQANALLCLGQLDRGAGRPGEARDRFCQALQIYRQLRAQTGEANALKALADLESEQDEGNLAREHYLEAAAVYTAEQNQLGLANTYQRLGDLERRGRRFAAAAEWYTQARDLYRREESPAGLAYTFSELARVSHALCDFSGSLAYLDEASQAAARTRHPGVQQYVAAVGAELRAGGRPSEV